jgi:mono/diheme cytochrome c family protein
MGQTVKYEWWFVNKSMSVATLRTIKPKRAIYTMIPGLMAALMFSALSLAQTPESKLPEGDGKQVTERVCSGCHGIDIMASERHTREEWQKVSDDMVARGADATDAEVKTIVEYLTKYFGPKNSKNRSHES